MGREVVREVVAVLSGLHSQRYTPGLGLTASIRSRVARASLEGAVNMSVRRLQVRLWLRSLFVRSLRCPSAVLLRGGRRGLASAQPCRRHVLCRTADSSGFRKSRTSRSRLNAFFIALSWNGVIVTSLQSRQRCPWAENAGRASCPWGRRSRSCRSLFSARPFSEHCDDGSEFGAHPAAAQPVP